MADLKWGIVATVKAPLHEVLGFAAYHLRLGAHRLYIYLDEPDEATFIALKAHPKIRVTQTDDAYWTKAGGRPNKHQPRQTINAADAYAKRTEVDWLTHIDHDEFLAGDVPLAEQLAQLPENALCARIRPVEALAWDGADTEPRPFKSFALPMQKRRDISQKLYPTFGAFLNGGFLSHVAGKMIYRTGIGGFSVKIHNAFLNGEMNPQEHALPGTRLCHLHGSDWQVWRAQYEYRKSKGAYRAELKPPFDKFKGGLNMHSLLSEIETDDPVHGLRAFHTELCTPRPELLDGLEQHGLLQWHTLDLTNAIAQQFPDHA